MPVCPKCSHFFGEGNFSSVASQINIAIEQAVNARIGNEQDEAERKRLHRLFRYWLSKEIRKKIGISWREAKEEHLDDALAVIEEWMNHYVKHQTTA